MSLLKTVTGKLILANFIVFIINVLFRNSIDYLALTPTDALYKGMIWQFLTFMYVHAGIEHILLNMWGLFMFGPTIEYAMGKKKFFLFYTITGISSGMFHILLTGISNTPLVGASGAIFGVMTAYGLMFPRQTIYFQLIIPMPAIVFIILIGLLQIVYGITGLEPGISNYGHLGGMIIGFILVKYLGFEKRKIRFFWEQ